MKLGKWFAICSIIGLTSFGLTACDEPPKTENVRVSLNTSSVEIDYYERATLTATVENSTKAVVWTTSDETIAVVENGVITPTQNAGNVTITASVGNQSASCNVNVVKSGNAPTLELSQELVSLGVGDTFTLSPEVYFKDTVLQEPFVYTIALKDGAQSGVAETQIAENQITFTAIAEGATAYEISTIVRDLTLVEEVEVQVQGDEVVFTSENLQPIEGGFSLDLGLTETQTYSTMGVIDVKAYKNGNLQTDFSPNWTMEQATDVFSLQNGVITALKEGTGIIVGNYQEETVTVHVNVIRPLIIATETLVLETVHTQMSVNTPLNGTPVKATLQKATFEDVSFDVTYADGKLTYGGAELPKAANRLGKQTLTVDTDKAKYRFPVETYTMIIDNETELNALIPTAKAQGNGTYWSGYYVLGGDITCQGAYASQWDGKRTGTAATAQSDGFNGVLDGNGYAIYNLTVTGEQGGLIPCLNAGGVIKNLSLVNAWNTGNGGLLVSHCGGTIENVYVSASVQGAASTRDQKYTSAFVSDVISTARIKKVFVEVLEKTGDTQYCNPFYVMHEKYGIVDGLYTTGTDSLWTKIGYTGALAENKDCGAFEDMATLQSSDVSLNGWGNEFWTTYNGLPYPKRLSLPTVTLTLTLSAKRVTIDETLSIVERSKYTLVTLSQAAIDMGIEIVGNTIVLPNSLQIGNTFTVCASNVFDSTQQVEIVVTVVGENDLKDGEFADSDIWA
jgi:hypothetical protein